MNTFSCPLPNIRHMATHLQTKVSSQQVKKTTRAAAWPQRVFTHSPFLQIEELFPSLEKWSELSFRPTCRRGKARCRGSPTCRHHGEWQGIEKSHIADTKAAWPTAQKGSHVYMSTGRRRPWGWVCIRWLGLILTVARNGPA